MKHIILLLNIIWYTTVISFLAFNPLQLHWLVLAYLVVTNTLFLMISYSLFIKYITLDYILLGADKIKNDV